MHSAQLCSSIGLKREVKEPLKKIAGMILFTKEIWATALKIVSFIPPGWTTRYTFQYLLKKWL